MATHREIYWKVCQRIKTIDRAIKACGVWINDEGNIQLDE